MLVATRVINTSLLLLSCAPILSRAGLLPSDTLEARSNPLGIHLSRAPSPEDAPSAAAHATRDKSLLPVQISSIVGAYVFVVCLVGIILLCLNRKIRSKYYISGGTLDIELVPATFPSFHGNTDPSPISPTRIPGGPRNFSWPSPVKSEPTPYVFPTTHRPFPLPAIENPFVDSHVVQADREMLNRDLEDIYAHVMEQEEAKAQGVILKEAPIPLRNKQPPPPPADEPSSPKKNTLEKQQSKGWLRRSDKSKPASLTLDDGRSDKTHSRSSILSALRSPGKRSSRPMQISSPMPTPLSATFPSSNEEEEPLTPRYHTPPPPPPVPKDQGPYAHQRRESGAIQPASPNRSIAEQLAPYPYPNSPTRMTHRVNTSQASTMRSSQSSHDPVSATSTTSATSQTPLFPIDDKSQGVGQMNRSLPFRQFEPTSASPSFATQSTKTTILERTNPRSPGLASGLRTPWSAGAVPYSPYQPFTPVLPMTPTLVTKKDRKAMKKAERKKPVLELIKSDDELWDSGY
ncbi:hypothetical protein BP5796_07904 [Coleophoma crateriformis]|uniref:Uncharacterized protein n=1 Tax=Coleophoma crateriformis TaxID=565419 RepID=A0A3D8RD24_9HELO|nr:hypothetical protein BP5796_07904 [Coleophoma crateriformis]